MIAAVSVRRFASRGGEKLDAALDELAIDVSGLRVLDAGGSTGGWTDCLLQRGASAIVYVDVAYGAIDWKLRTDDRVRVLERTNLREVTPDDVGDIDLATADLSFISLRTVRAALTALAPRLLLLVKPQFELPRGDVPRGGVVRDPARWLDAVTSVRDSYAEAGFALVGAAPSRLPGPKGNREFFLALTRDAEALGDEILAAAVEGAP